MSEPYHDALMVDRDPDLLQDFDFSNVTAESLQSLTDRATARSAALVDSIIASTERTYATTLAPLTESDDVLALAKAHAHVVENVHPDPAIREAGEERQKQLIGHGLDIIFNHDLYLAVKEFAATQEAQTLRGESALYLEHMLVAFRQNGHELDDDKREQLKKISQQISENELAFIANITEGTKSVALTEDELAGTSERFRQSLERDDQGRYCVTSDEPSFGPFMEKASNRDARRRVMEAVHTVAADVNPPLLAENIALRHQYALILGYPTYIHLHLEEEMARTPEAVENMYAALLPALTSKGEADIAAMTELLRADGYEGPLQRYDWAYYDTKQREREYSIDPEAVAEYLPLPAVLDGFFNLTSELLGISYRPVEAPTWHPDVQVFAIDDADSGQELAQFYLDMFPRDGKYKSAQALSLVSGREMPDGSYRHPRGVMIANFTKPTAEDPSLLQHDELVDFFHEFGHILHVALTRAKLVEFAGYETEGDFVEAPSQMMENWAWDAAALRQFTRHFQTGEPMPDEMVDNLVAAQRLNIALVYLRQIGLGLFDNRIHQGIDPASVPEVWKESIELSLFPLQEGTNYPASFGHVMDEEYAAGYYGYLWSEQIADDLYRHISEQLPHNPRIGLSYRHHVLERGGTVDAIDMIRNFLGREPSSDAFLRRLGIIEPTSQ